MARTMVLKKGSRTAKIVVQGGKMTWTREAPNGTVKKGSESFDDEDEAMEAAKAKAAELKAAGFVPQKKKSAAADNDEAEVAPAKKKTGKVAPAEGTTASGGGPESGKTKGKGRRRKAAEPIEITAKPAKKWGGKPGKVVIALTDKSKRYEFHAPVKDGAQLIDCVNGMRQTLMKMHNPGLNNETLNTLVREHGLVPAPENSYSAPSTKIAVRIFPKRAGALMYMHLPDGNYALAFRDLLRNEEGAKPKPVESVLSPEEIDEVLQA